MIAFGIGIGCALAIAVYFFGARMRRSVFDTKKVAPQTASEPATIPIGSSSSSKVPSPSTEKEVEICVTTPDVSSPAAETASSLNAAPAQNIPDLLEREVAKSSPDPTRLIEAESASNSSASAEIVVDGLAIGESEKAVPVFEEATPSVNNGEPVFPEPAVPDDRGRPGLTGTAEQPSTTQGSEMDPDDPPPSSPPRYRPPLAPRAPRVRRPRNGSASTYAARGAPGEIKILMRLERSGAANFSLLFSRPPGAPTELTVTLADKTIPLLARDDDWYEASQPPRLSVLLAEGFLISSRNGIARYHWALSAGRSFFVFAHQTGFGWLNQARLRTGMPQFIIVLDSERDRALSVLADSVTGAIPRVGQPPFAGWTVLGPISPAQIPSQVPGDDFFNMLRPLADLTISLDRGLWLQGNRWLENFPPEIKISGCLPPGATVQIDGVDAVCDSSGRYTTDSSGKVGDHFIYCAGCSATYRIEFPPEKWDAEVEPPTGTSGHLITVPTSHRVLLGARPDDFYICSPRSGASWTGFVPFTPVWALPLDAAHCDRAASSILALNAASVSHAKHTRGRKIGTGAVRWYSAILECKRKRLEVRPAEHSALWDKYVREAQRIRRDRRT